jgi:hypothetical protein
MCQRGDGRQVSIASFGAETKALAISRQVDQFLVVPFQPLQCDERIQMKYNGTVLC